MGRSTRKNGRVGSVDTDNLYRGAGAGLKAFGLTDSTTDLKTVVDTAVAWGAKRIVVPYRSTAWPVLSTISLTGGELYFEPGAQLSINHNARAMDLTNVQLTNASLTSPYTGPSSAGDNSTSGHYVYAARSVRLNGGCTVENYYHEYASGGIELAGAWNKGHNLAFSNIRQYQGWGAAIHCSSAVSLWNHFSNYTTTDCDRGNETETGASYNLFEHFTHTRTGPNGYTGQPVDYADYTFIVDVHSHTGEGACIGNAYRHGKLVDCMGGITAVRSNGSNDSDLPRNNTWEDISIEGRVGTTGYESVYIQGHNNHARDIRFLTGSGVTSMMKAVVATGDNSSVEITRGSGYALPLVTVTGTADGATATVSRLSAPSAGTGYLLDISGPNTMIDADIRAVTGTTGYLSLAAAAIGTRSRRFRYTLDAAETFASVITATGTSDFALEGIRGVHDVVAVKDFITSGGVTRAKLAGVITRTTVAESITLGASSSLVDTTRLDTTVGTINDSGVNSRIARQGSVSTGYVSTIADPAVAALIDNLSTTTPIVWPTANEGVGVRVRVTRRSSFFRFRFKVVTQSGNYYAAIANSAGVVLWKTRTSVPASGIVSVALSSPATAEIQPGEEIILALALDNTTAAVAGLTIATGDQNLLAGVRGTPHAIKLTSLYTANTPVGVQMTLTSNLAAFHPHITLVEA